MNSQQLPKRDWSEPQPTKMSQTHYPLSCLLEKNNSHLEQVKTELETRGWSFFKMDEPAAKYLSIEPDTMPTLYKGFKKWMEQSQKEKDKYRHVKYPENRFGYFATSRKEGFRFMTGEELEDLRIFENVKEFKTIAAACDKLAEHMMTDGCGKFLFNVKDEKDLDQLPLLFPIHPTKDNTKEVRNWSEPRDSLKHREPSKFGLFDIVKYHSSETFSEKFQGTDSQVNEHADPGLFSISLGSSAAGLEMFDPSTNEWVGVPNDTVVLWCGNEVTKVSHGTVKPGVHRVKASKERRVTAWYELCTREQIPSPSVANIPEELELELLKRLQEEDIGVSMSKSGIRRRDPIFYQLRLDNDDIKQIRQHMDKIPKRANRFGREF
jgi:isopenicillin N synthase-like dioxygenase